VPIGWSLCVTVSKRLEEEGTSKFPGVFFILVSDRKREYTVALVLLLLVASVGAFTGTPLRSSSCSVRSFDLKMSFEKHSDELRAIAQALVRLG